VFRSQLSSDVFRIDAPQRRSECGSRSCRVGARGALQVVDPSTAADRADGADGVAAYALDPKAASRLWEVSLLLIA
jgi:hypothetical protein